MSNLQIIPPGMNQEDTEKYLDGICQKKEEQTFEREFEPNIVRFKRDQIADISIELLDAEMEYESMKKVHIAKISEIKKKFNLTRKEVKARAETVTEQVWLVDDQETGLMNTLDKFGNCIAVRKLLPAEKQTRVHSINQLSA